MKFIDKVKDRISRNRLGKAFLEEYGFRTLLFAFLSLIFSVAFAVFNGVFAVLEHSVWYGSLAAYYVMLILFRSGIMIADRACKKRLSDCDKLLTAQNKIHLASGAFLVVTEIAMAAAITQMVIFTPIVNRGKIMAIANAVYAFTKITTAVFNLIKAKRFADPVSQSLRCLNFADACMSMVSLTVVLLTTFGESNEDSFLLAMKACVGFAACVIILALATYIIITSAKKLRNTDNE